MAGIINFEGIGVPGSNPWPNEFLALHTGDGIAVFDEGGLIVEANDRLIEMFGYSREELRGMNIVDLKPRESTENCGHDWSALRKTQSITFETDSRRRDGSVFATEISASAIEIQGRSYFQSIVRDITRRRQAQKQIERLKRMYAVLSRSNAVIIRSRSRETLFGEVCRIAVDSGGFAVSWIGRIDPVTLLVIPVAKAGPAASYLDQIRISSEDSSLGRGPIGACIRERRAVTAPDIENDPNMLPWRDAALRHGLRSSMCLPLSGSAGHGYVMGMYASEVSFFSEEEIALAEEVGASLSFALERMELEKERERAEADRQRIRERLELALDASNEGYWDLNLDTGECYTSPRFYTMLGYRHGELDQNIFALADDVHPDDRAMLEQVRESILRGDRESGGAEYRARHKDGSFVWIDCRVKVVERHDDGRPRRLVGIRNDITERKRLEEQFLQAQKMESVGRLAGGVAHDFNNHLTVINGYAELLRLRVGARSPVAGPLREIRDAGERAAALTRQLLAFSRKEIAHKTLVNVSDLIGNMDRMIRRLMGENVRLRLDLARDLSHVMADATQMEQIVMNLAVNARDAIAQQGEVTIQTASILLQGEPPHTERAGKWVQLSVIDNGSGMTPEVRRHIFEPFFTTKDESRGTGLGLATVYAIVESQGGFIDVETEPGRGSAFHIYLPVVASRKRKTRQERRPEEPQGGNETILVVEDQDNVRGAVVAMLKHYGYEVLAAANAADALDLASKNPGKIDLLLTDIMMPGMRGTELVRHLLPARPHLKVLYVSGYADESLRRQQPERGTLFLPKPYTPELLAAGVRRALSGGI